MGLQIGTAPTDPDGPARRPRGRLRNLTGRRRCRVGAIMRRTLTHGMTMDAHYPTPYITGIMLAAGLGTRFDPSGRHLKQLAVLDRRGSLLRICAQKLGAVVDELIIVHGPRSADTYRDVSDLPARQFSCLNAIDGMGRSLQAAIASSQPRGGWLVALADMPHIELDTYQQLRCSLEQGARLARPMYRGQPGHPVALAARMRNELMTLRADKGAGRLFKMHADQATLLETDDAGTIVDIDTPDDWRAAASPRPHPASDGQRQ